MNVVIDPEVLFINDEIWNQDNIRDEYLDNMFELFDYIVQYRDMKVYWDVHFENIMWSENRHPWLTEKDFKVPMVHSIFNILNKIKFEIDDSYEPCDSSDNDICDEVLRVMHYCLHNDEKVHYITNNSKLDANTFFFCSHDISMHPNIVADVNGLRSYSNIIDDYWPQNGLEVDKIEKLIDIYIDKNKTEVKAGYVITKNFVKSLVPYKEYGDKIIGQIVNRLGMSIAEARKDSMHDEYIKQNKERRIRVTGEPLSTRIHYTFDGQKRIEFKKFYGPGEHDVGLRCK